MTRAFTPPDTLSKDEIRTIADVRREIWTGGFTGLGVGSACGFFGHSVAQLSHSRGWWTIAGGGKAPYNRSTLLFSILAGGALGSFLGASTAGKNHVHQLHPIYEVGKVDKSTTKKTTTSYSSALRRAQEREESIRHLERRRLIRRETERDLEMTAAAAAATPKRSVQ